MGKVQKTKTVAESSSFELLWAVARRHAAFLLLLTNAATLTAWMVRG